MIEVCYYKLKLKTEPSMINDYELNLPQFCSKNIDILFVFWPLLNVSNHKMTPPRHTKLSSKVVFIIL